MSFEWTTNPVTGRISITDQSGRQMELAPTFEAALEIEDALRVGLMQLRVRAVVGGINGTADALTTREIGVIVRAGIKAAGEQRSFDATQASRWAWQTGWSNLQMPVVEFLNALADGGRLRERDLKNAASPNGSPSGLNGGDATEEVTESLIASLETAPPSGTS